MNSYTLFKFIDIIGVEIRKDSEGIFRIWRDGDTDFFPGYRLETDNEIYETTGGEVRHFTVVCK
jgi:hypothetical protein